DRRPAELHHDRAGARRRLLDGGEELVLGRRHRGYISLRPASARPSVTSSAYSRSPPTGRPLARRVTRTRPRRRSAKYAAAASPVIVGFVASTTSCTPFASTRRTRSSIRSWTGSTQTIGLNAPPRPRWRPR